MLRSVGFLIFLAGCVTSPVDRHGPFDTKHPIADTRSVLIPNVPFFPQESFQCGPASLASILGFRGGDRGPEEISGRIYSERLGGTLPLDLEAEAERYAEKNGLEVRVQREDPDLFRRELEGGRPLLVFVDLGFWVWRKGHFMVLVGYDDARGGVLAHSGKNRETWIPYRTFRSQWKRTGYWALSIAPKVEGKDPGDR